MLTRRAFATTSLALGATSAPRAQVPATGPIGRSPPSSPGRRADRRTPSRGCCRSASRPTSAARARPDGYTVVTAPNSTYAVAPHLYQVPYDADRVFLRVGLLVSSPLFMLMPRNAPVAEFVALAKCSNSRLEYANAGVGATSQLAT